MNGEEIIRMAREAGIGPVYGYESIERFAALVAVAEREKLAAWMMRQGYATGHGDTVEDLLKELDWQIEERIKNEREACAKVHPNELRVLLDDLDHMRLRVRIAREELSDAWQLYRGDMA
jgi:hypothetical protein